MKLVINACYGGFGLSERAFLWLIDNGMPVKPHIAQKRDEQGRWLPEPRNEGDHITDLDHPESDLGDLINPEGHRKICGRFGAGWLREDRHRGNELLVRCVEALGAEANGMCAKLKVVEIPDGIEWEVEEYDGYERIAEKHRSWA